MFEENANNNNNFNVVAKQNTKTIKTNPIYGLVETLSREANPLVAIFQLNNPQNIISHDDRRAFLLKFKSTPHVMLYVDEGFEFRGRHLSIDKFYSGAHSERGQHGFAQAHYTEYYKHPTSGETRTVHVYFADGIYIQLKHTQTNGDSKVEEGEKLEAYQLNSIQNNANEALNLYEQLKDENSQRAVKQLEKADALEKTLTALSRSLNTKTERQHYIALGQQFVQEIEILNRYDALKIDKRDKLVNMRMAFLSEIEDEVEMPAVVAPVIAQESEKNKSELNETSSLSSTKSHPKAANKNKSSLYKEYIFAKLQKRSTEFDNAKSNNLAIEQIKISAKIGFLLLECKFLTSLSAEESILVRTLEQKIKSFQNLLNFAFEQFLAGNQKAFCDVFSTLTSGQELSLVDKILAEINNQESEEGRKCEAQRSMCDYLFGASAAYRNKVKLENEKFYLYPELNLSMTRICVLPLSARKKTFVMLLRHGVSVHGVGGFYDKKPMSVLKMVSMVSPDPFYISELISKGASVDAPQNYFTQRECLNIAHQVEDGMKKTSSQKINSVNKTFQKLYSNPLVYSSDLLSACLSDNLNVIPFLFEKSSFENKLLALGIMVDMHDILIRHVFNKPPACYVFNTKLESDTDILLSDSIEKSVQIHIFASPHATSSTPLKLKTIQRMVAAIEHQMPKQDEQMLALLDRIEKMNNKDYPEITKHVYRTCRIVLCQKGVLNKAWAEKLVQYFCHVATALAKEGSRDLAINNYSFAKSMSEAFEITHLPVSEFAQKQLKKLCPDDAPNLSMGALTLFNRVFNQGYEQEKSTNSTSSLSAKVVSNKSNAHVSNRK